MGRINTQLKNTHEYIVGGSGTGKSSYLKTIIKKHKRVAVFDPDDEYSEVPGFIATNNGAEFNAALKAAGANKPIKIAFTGDSKAAFAVYCTSVFQLGNCLAVAEEISDVTASGKAPPAWGRLIRRGRKYGIKICAVTQRPAEADKTILSQAAFIRTFQLGRHEDRVSIAKEIGLDVDILKSMVPLEWVQYERSASQLTAGKIGKRRKPVVIGPDGLPLVNGNAAGRVQSVFTGQ